MLFTTDQILYLGDKINKVYDKNCSIYNGSLEQIEKCLAINEINIIILNLTPKEYINPFRKLIGFKEIKEDIISLLDKEDCIQEDITTSCIPYEECNFCKIIRNLDILEDFYKGVLEI